MPKVKWGPGLIGYAVASLMYGVTLGQSICYAYWFPDDPWLIKALVVVIFSADTVHMIGCTNFFWEKAVLCHSSYSWSCMNEVVWGAYAVVWLSYNITFVVECFYCRRIWTVSGKNKPFTFAIFIAAISGFVLGTWYNVGIARVGTLDYLFTSPLILPSACANTLCDFLITFAVFKYMWRSGFRRQRSIIQDLAVVCINTGAFTFTVSVITGIVYLVQGKNYWVVGAAIVISRSYVNAVLAVLNARRTIRDRDRNFYEFSTIGGTH